MTLKLDQLYMKELDSDLFGTRFTSFESFFVMLTLDIPAILLTNHLLLGRSDHFKSSHKKYSSAF